MTILCSTSDVITFDLYSYSAEGKFLSTEAQIRAIGSMRPEICTKVLRNWNEKLGAKFPSTTLGYSLVRIFLFYYGFSEILELEVSPEDGKELQQKDKKRRKGKGQKRKNRKAWRRRSLSRNFDICACPSKNVLNLVPRAHVPCGQHQDMAFWNSQRSNDWALVWTRAWFTHFRSLSLFIKQNFHGQPPPLDPSQY